MEQVKAKLLTEKIVAIALEELNGFDREEAERVASENEGHEFWERVEELLTTVTISDL